MSSPTSSPEADKEVRKEGIIGTVLILFFILLIGGIYIYYKWVDKSLQLGKRAFDKTIFSRFENFTSISFSKITITLIVAFLISDVVSGFNNAIMVPIVRAMFPDNTFWTHPVELTRGQIMYPGIFFQALVSFIFSIIIIFMIAEIIYQIVLFSSQSPLRTTVAKWIGGLLLASLILGLAAWNIYDIIKPVPVKEPRFMMDRPKINPEQLYWW